MLFVGSAISAEPPQFVDGNESEAKAGDESVGDLRWRLEQQVQRSPFAIQPHKRNYVIGSYFDSSFSNLDRERSAFEDALDHSEIKFQISIRVPVAENIFGTRADLYAAYSSKALWQAFNSEISSPFKDINHEPELFLLWPTQWKIGPVRSRALTLGFNHQSNGQNNQALVDSDGVVVYQSLSRSWNRLMLGAYFEQNNFNWHLQTWVRIPEEEKEDPSQAEGDDNPDIEEYLGDFELTINHLIKERFSSSLMLRNNLDSEDNRGAIRLEMTFPFTRKLDGMLQVFHGHGEHLLDYDSRNTRIGFGFTLRGM